MACAFDEFHPAAKFQIGLNKVSERDEKPVLNLTNLQNEVIPSPPGSKVFTGSRRRKNVGQASRLSPSKTQLLCRNLFSLTPRFNAVPAGNRKAKPLKETSSKRRE